MNKHNIHIYLIKFIVNNELLNTISFIENLLFYCKFFRFKLVYVNFIYMNEITRTYVRVYLHVNRFFRSNCRVVKSRQKLTVSPSRWWD